MLTGAVQDDARVSLRHVSGRSFTYLLCGISLLIAALLFGFFAWRDRAKTYEEATSLSINIAEVLSEHATRLIETSDLILRQAIKVAGPAGAPIPNSREAWRELTELAEATPYVVSIWLGDAQGDAVLTSRAWPAPDLNAAERDYFIAQREATTELFVTALLDNRFAETSLIVLSRRLDSPPDEFRGFATVTVTPEYLKAFYRNLRLGYTPTVEISRSDGTRLVREPPVAADRLLRTPQPAEFAELVQAGGSGVLRTTSALDGVERISAFQRLDRYPVVVSVGIDAAEVEARWRERLWSYSYYGIAGVIAILGLAALALQRARREEAAQRALIAANESLEQRVNERTTALQAALAEKDVLFKEVNHRVKNGLQMISSLLSLQAGTLRDEGMRQHFLEARNRVLTLAKIHERLYSTDKVDTVEFGEYLHGLCTDIASSFQASGGNCRIMVRTDQAEMPTDQVVPLALIANELITNAFKYAYPDHASGTVQVTFDAAREHHRRIIVSDEGVGLPDGFDPGTSDGLGMRLVTALTGQLGARLEVVEQERGAGFAVVLPP